MKKLFPIIILLAIISGGYYYYQNQQKAYHEKAATSWQETKENLSIIKLEDFVNEFSKSEFADSASTLLDSLKMEALWDSTVLLNSVKAFRAFKIYYPASPHAQELETLMESAKLEQAWKTTLSQNTITAFKAFKKNYPKSKYDATAQQKIIDLEVDKIFSGKHGHLPPAQAVSGVGSRKSNELTIENGTSYTLTVLYSGPQSRKLVISTGKTKSVKITNGHYRVAASVNAANVIPFAGEQDFLGGEYSSRFYITGL